jgi:hypothetical protein
MIFLLDFETVPTASVIDFWCLTPLSAIFHLYLQTYHQYGVGSRPAL